MKHRSCEKERRETGKEGGLVAQYNRKCYPKNTTAQENAL